MSDQAAKMARFYTRPFEVGDGVRHEPGVYTWLDGQAHTTLQRVYPEADNQSIIKPEANALIEGLRQEGYTIKDAT